VTHEHFDHFFIQKIKDLSTENTVIIGTAQCKKEMEEIREISPGQTIIEKNVKIEAIPAYNINKFRKKNIVFHPKKDQKNGYIIEVDGTRIYHAGDTDFIPEMKELKNIDIALLPVSGTYVMTPEEAAEAANYFKPKIAVPMHYNSIVGSMEDAKKFKKICNGEVRILKQE
jgi:L-ascorbate metabolism protein UlaG (beta-lactamase superfamily)